MKKINFDDVLWFLILYLLYIYIFYLLFTGKIDYFIHPRMVKYIELSLVALTILVINQVFKIFKTTRKSKVKKGYVLFLIPLLLGFIVSPNGLDSSMADKKGYTQRSASVPPQNATTSTTIANATNKESAVDDYFENGTVTFNNDEYLQIYEEVSRNSKKYDGKKVIIEGFVYKDKSFKKDEFVAARFLMICCAADTSLVGLMGKWEKASTLKSGDWIRMQGKINYASMYDENTKEKSMVPIVDVEKITKIEMPEMEYIYP